MRLILTEPVKIPRTAQALSVHLLDIAPAPAPPITSLNTTLFAHETLWKRVGKDYQRQAGKIKLWLELATSCFTLLDLLLNFHEATWALLGLVYVWTWVYSTEIQLYLGRGSFSQRIQKICGMGTRATVHARATPICTTRANLQGQLPSCTSHLIWQLGISRER